MIKKLASYFEKLRFDPKLNNGIIASYLRNPRLLVLLVMLIIIAGSFSLASIPRVLNPDVKIPLVLVSTALPGASPTDVESLITIPIEDAVMGVTNVKTVTSSSTDSFSSVQVEFQDGVDPDKARQDVQSAVNGVTGLPTDVQTPVVQKLDFQKVPVWIFIVTSKSDNASLNRFSKILQQKIKDLSSVNSVTTSGLDNQEIEVVLKPEAISTYAINPQQIAQLINTAKNSFPAGNVQSSLLTFSFTIDPQITTIDDVRHLEFSLNGKSVQLGDIANVYEKAKPGEFQSFFASANHSIRNGVTFSVLKNSNVSIDQAVLDTKKVIEDTLQQYDNQFEISTILNTSDQIDTQFNELFRDFAITILLVFATLFIFVGIRQAIVALLATPLSFFITFTVMRITSIDLSFIAIFSLLLSLGLLVDDTIVVISAMTQYYRIGRFTPQQTGLLVWRDFITAITTTTITTVFAFVPLLLSTGIIGDFIKPIPIVVSTTLLGSYIVAMLITLPSLVILLKPNVPYRVVITVRIFLFVILALALFFLLTKGSFYLLEIIAVILFLFVFYQTRTMLVKQTKRWLHERVKHHKVIQHLPYYFNHGVLHFEKVAQRYKIVMYNILQTPVTRRRILVMVIIFSLFSYLLLPLGFVRNEFFPKSPADEIMINLEFPSGTNVQTTTAESLKLLDQLRSTKGIKYVSLDIGSQVSNQLIGGASSSNLASFSLVLPPKDERQIDSLQIAQNLRDRYRNYQKGTLQVVEESGGPPAGADVQIKLFGSDLTVLQNYADKIKTYLHTQPGLTNIDTSLKPGTSKITFVPDKAKLAEYGLTTDQVSSWIRLFASGQKATDIILANEGRDKIDITVRMSTADEYAEAINSITIPTQSNGNVPLISLGQLQLEANPTLITRESGKRTISVTAAVSQGYSVSLANANLEKYADSKLNLPVGYSWTTGGVNQQNQESVNSILQAMLLSFFLIIVTMVIQFGSFRKALIVMLVIPLSIAGVFILFALTHTPLSFPALIGVLALFGIVVKNSILIVDKINQNYRYGMNHVEAVADAAASRLEPIALTSFATIIGLIPITLSNPLWTGLGGAIIAGLAFSGTIMLFFIPVVYYYWFRNDRSLEKKQR